MEAIKRLALAFFTKKRIAGWLGGAAIAAGAAAAGMQVKEVREAVCEAAKSMAEAEAK